MPITKIRYRFGDASVPPPYHRSYTITLTSGSVRTVVDSYGDILADKQHPVGAGDFASVAAALDEYAIGRTDEVREHEGCTGGTTDSIACWEGETEVLSVSVYHCGGGDYGDLTGDIKGFASRLKMLVPDLDQLVK